MSRLFVCLYIRSNRLQLMMSRRLKLVVALVAMCLSLRTVLADNAPVQTPATPVPLFQQATIDSPRPLPSAAENESDDIQALKEARVKELERQIREVNERISRLRAERQTTESHVNREPSKIPVDTPKPEVPSGNLIVPDPMSEPVKPPEKSPATTPANVKTATPQMVDDFNTAEPASVKSDDPKSAMPSTPNPKLPVVETTAEDPTESTQQSSKLITPSERVLIPLHPGTLPATFPPRLPATEETTPGVPPTGDMLTPPPALTGEIDRMALANSLFATGQFEQCLQTLDAVLDSTLTPEDRSWKVYLRACCHRSLNNTQEAVRIYRTIANGSKGDWTHELALWWLDHLTKRDQLIEQSQQLRTVVTEFKKGRDQLEKSRP